MPHAILYPLFDFHFQNQLPSFFDTENQLRNLIMFKALAIMEEVMDEFEIKNKIWYIDKLELDLGEIDLDNIYRDFPPKLRQVFRKSLAKIRFDAQLVPEIHQNTTENSQETHKQVAWEALQMYISEGEKRWWMLPNDQNIALGVNNSQKTLFNRLFDYVAEQNPEELKAFLQKIKENETAKNRILGQISTNILIKTVLGEKNALLYQYFFQITQELTQIAGFFSAKNSFEKFFLLEFWAYSLGKNITFTKENLQKFLYQLWGKFSKKIPYFPSLFSLPNRLQNLSNVPKISQNTQKFISESIEKSLENKNLNIYQEISIFTQSFSKNAQENWQKYLLFWENQLIKSFDFSKENAQKIIYNMVFKQNISISNVPQAEIHIQYLEKVILTQKTNKTREFKDDFLVKMQDFRVILRELRKDFADIKIPSETEWEKQVQNNKILEKNYAFSDKITKETEKQTTKNEFKEKELMELVAEIYPNLASDLILFLRELFAKNAWFNAPSQTLKKFVWQTIADYFLKNRYSTPDLLDLIKEILKNIQKKFNAEAYNYENFWKRSNIITQYNTQKIEWKEILAQEDFLAIFSGKNIEVEKEKISDFLVENITQIQKLFGDFDFEKAKFFTRLVLGDALFKNLGKLLKYFEKSFEIVFFRNFLAKIFQKQEILKNEGSDKWKAFFAENENDFWVKILIKTPPFEQISWQKIQQKFQNFALPNFIFTKTEENKSVFDKVAYNWQKITNINQIKIIFSTKKEKEFLMELVLDSQKNTFLTWVNQLSKLTSEYFKGISANIETWKEILMDNLLEYLFLNKEKTYKIADFAQYLAEKWIKNYHITPEYLQETFIDFSEWQSAIRQNRQNVAYSVQSLRYFLETGAILWTATWKNQGFSELEKHWVMLMETQSQVFKAVLGDFRLSYMDAVPAIVLENIKHNTLKRRILESLGYEWAENQVLSKKQLRKKLLKEKNQTEQNNFEGFFAPKTDSKPENEEEIDTNEDIFPLQKSTLQRILRVFQEDLEKFIAKINQIEISKEKFAQNQIFEIENLENIKKLEESWQKKYDWAKKMLDFLQKNEENQSQTQENLANNLKNHWAEIETHFPKVFSQKINPLWFSLEVSKDFLQILTKKLKDIIQKQAIWLKNLHNIQTQKTNFLIENTLPNILHKKIKRNIQSIYQNYQNATTEITFEVFEIKKQEFSAKIFNIFENLSIKITIKKSIFEESAKDFIQELEISNNIQTVLADYLLDDTKKMPKNQNLLGFEQGFKALKMLKKEKKTLFLAEFSKKLQEFYKHFLAVLEGIYVEIEKVNALLANNPQLAQKINVEKQINQLFSSIFTHWKVNFSPKATLKSLLNAYTLPQNKDFAGINLQDARLQAHIWVENLLHFEKHQDFSNFLIKIQSEDGHLLNFREFLQEFYKNFPEILAFQWQNISKKLKNEVKNLLPTLYKILSEETQSFYQEFQNINQQIGENTYQGRGNKVENPKENAKKILEKIAEITQKAEKKQAQRKDEPLYVQNAGLVILHPYLARLFGMLGWFQEGKFVDLEAQTKAVLALEFMVNKKYEGLEEGDLLLNKILVGMTFKDALLPEVTLTEKELDTCESLLKGVMQNWKPMADSTIDNFRVSFLRREGRLIDNFGAWTLRVEQKTWDILMNSLPWSIVIVKLPFMRVVLNVEWGQ